jgi:hypothetical protein
MVSSGTVFKTQFLLASIPWALDLPTLRFFWETEPWTLEVFALAVTAAYKYRTYIYVLLLIHSFSCLKNSKSSLFLRLHWVEGSCRFYHYFIPRLFQTVPR